MKILLILFLAATVFSLNSSILNSAEVREGKKLALKNFKKYVNKFYTVDNSTKYQKAVHNSDLQTIFL